LSDFSFNTHLKDVVGQIVKVVCAKVQLLESKQTFKQFVNL
jgi:hypothetical protein